MLTLYPWLHTYADAIDLLCDLRLPSLYLSLVLSAAISVAGDHLPTRSSSTTDLDKEETTDELCRSKHPLSSSISATYGKSRTDATTTSSSSAEEAHAPTHSATTLTTTTPDTTALNNTEGAIWRMVRCVAFVLSAIYTLSYVQARELKGKDEVIVLLHRLSVPCVLYICYLLDPRYQVVLVKKQNQKLTLPTSLTLSQGLHAIWFIVKRFLVVVVFAFESIACPLLIVTQLDDQSRMTRFTLLYIGLSAIFLSGFFYLLYLLNPAYQMEWIYRGVPHLASRSSRIRSCAQNDVDLRR